MRLIDFVVMPYTLVYYAARTHAFTHRVLLVILCNNSSNSIGSIIGDDLGTFLLQL